MNSEMQGVDLAIFYSEEETMDVEIQNRETQMQHVCRNPSSVHLRNVEVEPVTPALKEEDALYCSLSNWLLNMSAGGGRRGAPS